MDRRGQVGSLATSLCKIHQIGKSFKEAFAALHGALVPRSGTAVVPHKEDVGAQNVCAENVDHIVGVYYVSAGFGHLFTVGAENEALCGSLCVRLCYGNYAQIIKEFVPETGIDHMARNVLHTAVVPVNGHPILELFGISQRLGVVRIDIAQEVPGRACPLRHGVGLSLCSTTALGALAVDKGFDFCQGALTALAGLKVLDLGQAQRKLTVRNGNDAARGTVNDRDGLTPISLAVECPVLHLVLHAHLTDALLGEVLDHARDGVLLIVKAVEEVGVDHLSVACVCAGGDVAALDDLNNVDAKLLCKRPVALVVCGNCHNSARTVAHHNVVGNVDRDLLARNGVDGGKTLDANTGLFLNELSALELGLFCALLAVSVECFDVGDLISVCLDDGMLGRDDHKGYAKERIGACCINTELFVDLLEREIDERAGGFADPVDLLLLYVGEIVDLLKSLQKLVCILGDAQIPNGFGLLHDGTVADIAFAALGILVGKNDLAAGAIVDECIVAENESVFEHFEEDPLRPAVVILLGGIHYARPVKGETNSFELGCKLFDVAVGDDSGVEIILDSGVLGGKTVCIKADREQYVIALHSSLAGDDLKAGICLDVAYVHAVSAGIRELDKVIVLGLGAVVLCFKGVLLFPSLLPFGFNLFKIVFHICSSLSAASAASSMPTKCISSASP